MIPNQRFSQIGWCCIGGLPIDRSVDEFFKIHFNGIIARHVQTWSDSTGGIHIGTQWTWSLCFGARRRRGWNGRDRGLMPATTLTLYLGNFPSHGLPLAMRFISLISRPIYQTILSSSGRSPRTREGRTLTPPSSTSMIPSHMTRMKYAKCSQITSNQHTHYTPPMSIGGLGPQEEHPQLLTLIPLTHHMEDHSQTLLTTHCHCPMDARV